jgi:hypothetical protein
MLHKEAVSSELFELLTNLMGQEAFNGMRLVGGTALALQFGHRISVDIDLFGYQEEDDVGLVAILSELGSVERVGSSASIHVFFVDGIKVDFVNYPYPWLDGEVLSERIRMASVRDIAAMKVAAITNRGSRKDFIDLYFLLQEYRLDDICSFYREKFSDGNEWLALRSMTFFEDADREPMPAMLRAISWSEVKSCIVNAVREYSGFH